MSKRENNKKKGIPVFVDCGEFGGFFVAPDTCTDEELEEMVLAFYNFLLSCQIDCMAAKLCKVPPDQIESSFQGNPPTELQ
jgi:hypothetical protein